jgi:acyl-CoA thioester hydrolase
MYVHEHKIRPRYSETDKMGFVYYGNYATFYEIGRVESLRDLGFSYKEMEESGVMLPVLECNSKFLKPAKYDEQLTVKTTLKEMITVKAHFEHEIYNENNALIHKGVVTLVFMDANSYRPCRPPKKLIELFKPYFS